MHFVYLLISSGTKPNTYVGYTNDLFKRVTAHNSGKGAKYTRGRHWILAYYEIFKSKNLALKREHALKKNYKLRKSIKDNYLINL
ncbi:MAG: GIY-YIG nuclease family protein [Pelagibacteraceae bacterium]|jgi:putative endonuclease|uniref:GIY-YIG nuclease family protein n=1 Tax=Pelagibacter sp. (strain IMCC9063) TaxID=1002672 RepID=UPI00020467D0|nr:GIY-YIG nuclease family protein [Candidatus Pelagibacter sp. IMCC9063]AEA81551.1 excinuclease ABC [Candidatus Pelagibacter sp. IMCC9063]MDB0036599.1 GIY-YIG nuclease family protein [Pelagibacteraceae bacterium]|tara:strand:- start:118 stop:372 length:255 start_codon:yes stop_codon:yes gene_type:complete